MSLLYWSVKTFCFTENFSNIYHLLAVSAVTYSASVLCLSVTV